MVKNIFSYVVSTYNYVMSVADDRTETWPLMSSPWAMLSLIFSYVYFVKVLGPAWMKNRKPFQIERLLIAYNISMVVLSATFFFYGGSFTYLGKYNWFCQPIDYSSTPENLTLLSIGWWYLLLKIAEFADTIFFVLRKKFTHISVLHVVHHSLVAWGVWIGMKFGAGGHNAFFPFINCFVHMIMYFYYCLAAMGPSMKKYLWWKKYLTVMQMVQFVVAFIHAAIPLFYDCNFQPGFAYALMAHAVLFYAMFLNFYRKAYKAEKSARAKSAAAAASNGYVKNGCTPITNGHKNGYVNSGKNGVVIKPKNE